MEQYMLPIESTYKAILSASDFAGACLRRRTPSPLRFDSEYISARRSYQPWCVSVPLVLCVHVLALVLSYVPEDLHRCTWSTKPCRLPVWQTPAPSPIAITHWRYTVVLPDTVPTLPRNTQRPRRRRHRFRSVLAVVSGNASRVATRPSGRLARIQTAERTSRDPTVELHTASLRKPASPPRYLPIRSPRSPPTSAHIPAVRYQPRPLPPCPPASTPPSHNRHRLGRRPGHRVAVHRRRQTKSMHCVRQTRVVGNGGLEDCRTGST
ncbi:hypothetical protein C8F01DRAFT_1192105 [Mycena amicta]|nr:hypothetical protein C8F01DRAFT_1192105 [Mycena amicta]